MSIVRNKMGLLIISSTLSLLAGCGSSSRNFGGSRNEGLVLLLPGSEGQSPFNDRVGRALISADVKSSVELRDWTGNARGLVFYNQLALDRNRAAATRIAHEVCDYQDTFPGRPVQIIGHSAGAAVALFVAEALPAERVVDTIYLLGPSLSPGYDLTTALSRTRRSIYSFSSDRDLVLSAGTSILGTVDHYHTPAAGWSGFENPSAQNQRSAALYRAKLVQVRWSDDFRELAADGSHFGWTSPSFVYGTLAALIHNVELPDIGIKNTRIAAGPAYRKSTSGDHASSHLSDR